MGFLQLVACMAALNLHMVSGAVLLKRTVTHSSAREGAASRTSRPVLMVPVECPPPLGFVWATCDQDVEASETTEDISSTSELALMETGTPLTVSPLGNPFSAQRPLAQPDRKWEGATGTSFLPEDAIKRAAEGNPIEKAKLAKDATTIFNSVYEYAAAIRSGEMDWEDVEKADFNTRLKWVGLVHRDKRTPGKFMMRMRIPNGIINADLLRFYADCVEPYGPDLGVIDITTRQNIQIRGVQLEDAPKIIDGLHARGQSSFHSALDNVRNMVGSPLAGIDDQEMVDTRSHCEALNDLITLNKQTGERGNPVWSNLPRKFNVAVSGSRDDFAHTHINDIGLQPCVHATTGEMGFNVVLGGYMSTKRVAESIDMNLWVPDNTDATVELSTAILRVFRDEGNRKDRQKARLMWLVESYGPVLEVEPYPGEGLHARCDPSYREKILAEMESYGNGIVKLCDVQQPRPMGHFERRELNGIYPQPQPGLHRVGVHVPVGRLSVTEARQLADLAERYVPDAEVRLTVEQNVILPNVKEEHLPALCAEPCLNGESRLIVNPGKIVGNLVSCTGAQFCGLAMIETKNNAEEIAKALEERVAVPRGVRIHWTGCPNSCGQVQAGDIGLMGGPAKKMNAEGKMKAVPGVKVFVGGTIGEHGKLQLDTTEMNGGADSDGVPIEDLVPVLTQIIVDRFDGTVKPEFEEEQTSWRIAREHADAAKVAAAAAKAAAKKARAAAKT